MLGAALDKKLSWELR